MVVNSKLDTLVLRVSFWGYLKYYIFVGKKGGCCKKSIGKKVKTFLLFINLICLFHKKTWYFYEKNN